MARWRTACCCSAPASRSATASPSAARSSSSPRAIEREPDSTTQVFALGPRLLISQQALDATGLVQPGSLVYHSYRIKTAPDVDRLAAARALNAAFPTSGWRIRQLEDAGQRTRDFLENTRAYLDLIGLSALLIGGLGIANAVRAHLEGKARTIAMMKCIGATSGQIAAVNLITIGVMAAISILIGLAIGATAPFLFQASLARMEVDLAAGLYWQPLARAAAFGALTALRLLAALAAARAPHQAGAIVPRRGGRAWHRQPQGRRRGRPGRPGAGGLGDRDRGEQGAGGQLRRRRDRDPRRLPRPCRT